MQSALSDIPLRDRRQSKTGIIFPAIAVGLSPQGEMLRETGRPKAQGKAAGRPVYCSRIWIEQGFPPESSEGNVIDPDWLQLRLASERE